MSANGRFVNYHTATCSQCEHPLTEREITELRGLMDESLDELYCRICLDAYCTICRECSARYTSHGICDECTAKEFALAV